MSAYSEDFDGTKYIYFLIKNDELLEKYNEIWEKCKNNMKNNLIVNLHNRKNIYKLK